MKKLILLLTILLSATVFSQDITGTWSGPLDVQGMQLRMLIKITQNETGYTGTLDSPDQGAKDIPVSDIVFKDNILTFAVPAAGVQYKGTLENETIKGTFSQGGTNLPLNFSRGTGVKRPQEPQPPFTYHSENVTFKNDKAGITLSGTLTLPKTEGNFPAVILISGSGPHNRDEEIAGHKPFLLLADHLTKNGIAVLRYDERGIGESEGDFSTATSADFANDAEAAFNYLKTRKEINKKEIGLLGHSEGGMVAPMVAERNKDAAFIVLLAGPGIKITELMVLQNYAVGKALGLPEATLEMNKTINSSTYAIVTGETDPEVMKDKLKAHMKKTSGAGLAIQGATEKQIDDHINAEVKGITSPWFIYFLKADPTTVLEKIKCPILALNGSNDVQVNADENLNGIKLAAARGGNKKVTVKKLEGLNHLFQESATGLPQEYGKIEQTMSPVVLDEVANWINNVTK